MSRTASAPGADAHVPPRAELASVNAAIGRVLRWGVLLAAALIVAGVALFVAHGGTRAILFSPVGVPAGSERDPHSLRGVLDGLLPPQPAAVTDAGLLLLMITPVVSVAISVVAFAARRDWLYVAISGFVFAMLMVGFAIGRA
ncbi:MAG TPA: DUF1634 domain-containing protein [bacterium]|nr:DUF1634 domain-containing protein [bacterium]